MSGRNSLLTSSTPADDFEESSRARFPMLSPVQVWLQEFAELI